MRPDSAQPANAPPAELYVHVVAWRGFQHYGKPRPAWIKNHGSLLHKDAYLGLSAMGRALLHGLWMEYAASCTCDIDARDLRCTCLRLDVHLLNRRLGLAAKMRDYESLNHAGFLTFHSREALEQLYSGSSPEVETEREKNPRATPVAQPAPTTALEIEGSQTLVAYFVDRSRTLGSDPPGRVKGQVARLIGELVHEGDTPARIRAGIDVMLDKRLGPSTLPSCVQEAALPRNGHAAGLSPEQIMLQAVRSQEGTR